MKSTSAIALVASLLPVAFASPLIVERDANVEYKYVTNVEVVTAWATAYATEGAAPVVTYTAPAVAETTSITAEGRGKGRNRSKWFWSKTSSTVETTSSIEATSSTEAPAPPAPTTTSTPEPAPQPTTTSTTSTSETPIVVVPTVVVPTVLPTPTSTYVAPVYTAPAYTAPAYTAPASTGPSTYTGDDSYSDANIQLAIINSTNTYRAKFQAQPLAWNQTLVDMAKASAAKCDFEHSNAGQNLAAGYSGPEGAVGGWGDEYKTFDFSKPDFSETCGHFTQLVWQDSTTTGCAAKKCPTDGSTGAQGWYLVCNYFPVGNMLGEFSENVKSAL